MALLFSAIVALEVASKLFHSIVDHSATTAAQNATVNYGLPGQLLLNPNNMAAVSNNMKMRQNINFHSPGSTAHEGSTGAAASAAGNDPKTTSLFEVMPQFEVDQSQLYYGLIICWKFIGIFKLCTCASFIGIPKS